MKSTQLTIAGFDFICGVGKNGYWISMPHVEKALGWGADSGRKKLEAKSLKALAEAESGKIQVGKSKIEYLNQRYSCISTETFFLILNNEANSGNVKVLPFLVALAKEAIERRINAALDINVSEETEEERTRKFFRELARRNFQPKYCAHLSEQQYEVNYGAEVNRLKQALRLPLTGVDTYTQEHMEVWCEGVARYDILRHEGYGHQRALQVIARQIEARKDN